MMNIRCEYMYYQTKEKQITPSAQVADEFKLLFNSLFWLYKLTVRHFNAQKTCPVIYDDFAKLLDLRISLRYFLHQI